MYDLIDRRNARQWKYKNRAELLRQQYDDKEMILSNNKLRYRQEPTSHRASRQSNLLEKNIIRKNSDQLPSSNKSSGYLGKRTRFHGRLSEQKRQDREYLFPGKRTRLRIRNSRSNSSKMSSMSEIQQANIVSMAEVDVQQTHFRMVLFQQKFKGRSSG